MRILIFILLASISTNAQFKRIVITPASGDIIRKAISDTTIRIIQVDKPIDVSGVIDFKGKTLVMSDGTQLIGSVILRNVVIEAGYNQHIFTTETILENAIVTQTLVSVKWFGAKGDGITDDAPAIQAAGDAIIKNNSLPRGLYFPWGTYRCDKELFFYNWTGTDYGFFSLNLIGQEGAYFNNTLTEARIVANHNKTFAVGYQTARSSLIRGIVIQGQFNPTGSGNYREYVSRPYSTWAQGVSDKPTAPYSGISIDPVDNSGTLGMTGRYEGLENMYRGTGVMMHSGSSGIKIEQCRVQGFAVDIAISLNSITSNAENIHIIDCTLDQAKAAVAYGQDQTKDNFIIRCISWDRVHTLVDTKNYGRGTGQAPYVDGWNVAGDIVQLWQFSPLRAACSWRNVFAESLWRIGDGDAGAGLSLESSTINFKLGEIMPASHITGAKIVFKGCVIKYYDNRYDKRMRLIGADYRFEDCELDRVPLFDPSYTFGRLTPAQFINCISGDGQLGRPYAKGQYPSQSSFVAYGQITFEEGGLLQGPSYNYIKDLRIKFDCSWPNKEQRIDVVVITVDDAKRTAIMYGGGNQIAIGDYITSEAGIVYGRVAAINRTQNTADLVEIPIGINGTIQDHCITHWVDKIAGQFIGDINNGSNTILNVEYDVLLPQPYVGQRLKIGHSITTPIVDAIDGNTITMSVASDYSLPNAFNSWNGLQSFELTTTGGPTEAGAWPVLIPKGAVFYKPFNRFGLETKSECIKAGFVTGKRIALWSQK